MSRVEYYPVLTAEQHETEKAFAYYIVSNLVRTDCQIQTVFIFTGRIFTMIFTGTPETKFRNLL